MVWKQLRTSINTNCDLLWPLQIVLEILRMGGEARLVEWSLTMGDPVSVDQLDATGPGFDLIDRGEPP